MLQRYHYFLTTPASNLPNVPVSLVLAVIQAVRTVVMLTLVTGILDQLQTHTLRNNIAVHFSGQGITHAPMERRSSKSSTVALDMNSHTKLILRPLGSPTLHLQGAEHHHCHQHTNKNTLRPPNNLYHSHDVLPTGSDCISYAHRRTQRNYHCNTLLKPPKSRACQPRHQKLRNLG